MSLFSGPGCLGDGLPGKKQIAITFDDAPVMRFYSHPSQWHRQLVVDSLTSALARHRAPATIFAVGDLVREPEGAALLEYWLEKGVELGNHSMTHTNFNELTQEQGRAEISEANDALEPFAREYAQSLRYFRFPYLAEGVDRTRKAAWVAHLEGEGLRNARVTLNTKDWEYDAAYAEAELAEDWARRYEVGQAYLRHIREVVRYWDDVAVELAGRHIRHVLLLHANRINRDYLGVILAELEAQGYEFITLDEAYQDPIYDAPDEWVSEDGTSFLENLRQTRIQQAEAGAPPAGAGG